MVSELNKGQTYLGNQLKKGGFCCENFFNGDFKILSV